MVNSRPASIAMGTLREAMNVLLRILSEEENKEALSFIKRMADGYRDWEDLDRVPIEAASFVSKQLSDILGLPNMGLEIAGRFELVNIPIFSFMIDNFLPGRDFLRLVCRYFTLATEVGRFEIVEGVERSRIILTPTSPETICRHQVEALVCTMLNIFKIAKGPSKYDVKFSHCRPKEESKAYVMYLGSDPAFDQDENSIAFDSRWLNDYVGLGKTNSIIANIKGLEALRSQTLPIGMGERCSMLIEEALAFGEPTRQQIAQFLGVSVSTLQRHLASEGLEFKSVLKATRIKLCQHYLLRTQYSCNDLAFLLGYQDPSQFYKVFKDWFGTTPNEYRTKHGNNDNSYNQ